MTDEKLKEIKDSIDFQERITKEHNFDMTFLQEEIDLYDEVIRLRKQLDNKNGIFMASFVYANKYANILSEYEKWLEEKINFYKNNFQGYSYERYKECLEKLQDLKGSDKNE